MLDLIQFFSWPLLLVGAYLLGSIPFAQVLARANGVDLRNTGTGNIGAGNLALSVGRKWGLLAAFLDGLKGLIPVLIARYGLGLGLAASGMAGLAAVAGHNWSIFMKGRSGRGLATAAGLIVGLDPVLIVWVGGWSLAGRKFGGGFAGFLGWGLLPLVAIALGRPAPETLFLVLLSAVLIGRRMQGNPDSVPGLSPALRRALYDTDRQFDDFGQAADEARTS
jgi:acyl phosphate:glycerol-3-phosphate acyltransferase